MKILKKIFIPTIIIVGIVALFSGCEEDEVIQNISDKTYTLMVYLCGSDLESDGEFASDDIEEMLKSQLDEKVNLLIYTGGTKDWSDERISDKKNQIFKVENHDLVLVNDKIGQKYMTDPDTLEEFLNFTYENYPADRYGLILWDHGGGAVSGFGYDENNPDEEETLTIDELKSVLDKYENKLEFIGFDACLMANFETAFALKNNAKYLVASEEIEPGTGWDYVKLLNQLSRDTSQDISDLGKVIVDSYIKSNDSILFGSDATLSVIDLSKIDGVYEKVLDFLLEIKEKDFKTNNYFYVSKALNSTKAFGDGEIDTIDLVDFANVLNLDSTKDLVNSVNDAVFYNKTTTYVENSNGLSLYFPNEDLDYYDDMLKIYKKIGFGQEYIDVINEYVNIVAGGSKDTYSLRGHEYDQGNDYDDYDWYDSEFINGNSSYYDENDFEVDELELIEKGDDFILELSDDDWNLIADIKLNVWYDDGEGYIDLGTDTSYDLDDDDNLIVSFDNQWFSIDGNFVAYEPIEQTEKYEKGRIPATVNGEDVYLIVYWKYDETSGKIVGYKEIDSYGNTCLQSRGYKKLNQGDKVRFVVDYYDYDGEYDDSYYFGDEITVGKKGLTVKYEDMDEGTYLINYMIEDIYGNIYYTESLEFEF